LATLALSADAPGRRACVRAGKYVSPMPAATSRGALEPTCRRTLQHIARGDRRLAYDKWRASCVRDFTSSLRNALRRWYSTVLAVMKS
jgi:hypothetical protein